MVDNLSKAYKARILRSVSFTLDAGQGLGVLGFNGCGKTTLLDIIAGLRKQDGGSYSTTTAIGYVMQKSGFQEGLSCLDNLRLEAALCGLRGEISKERIGLCIDDCQLESFIRKKAGKCSVGMRARLAIALSLIPNPGLLLLDEAFVSLDETSKSHIIDVLKKRKGSGMAILMVSHSMEDFPGLCERALRFPDEEVVEL